MEEIWKDIKNYEGYYQVSNFTRVKSLERLVKNGKSERLVKEKVLKPSLRNGYLAVSLSKEGELKTFKLSRLVAKAFIPNPDNKPTVNHIDGVKTNDIVSNLEWNTHSENIQHAFDTGLKEGRKGSKHGRAKLTNEIVLTIRASKNKTHQQLADEFQICRQHISKIINRKSWKHI